MVDITKLVTLVLDVDLVVVLEQEKHLLVHRRPIVYVPKTLVLVPLVLLLPEQRVPHMVPQFARLVPMDTTKLVVPVLDVDLDVVREQEKQRLVRRQLIVHVHPIRVLVQMVQLPLVQLVLPMVPAFVRPVPVDISKMLTTFVPLSYRRIIPMDV